MNMLLRFQIRLHETLDKKASPLWSAVLWELEEHVFLHIFCGFSWDVSSCNLVLKKSKSQGGTVWKLSVSKHSLLGKVESNLIRLFNLLTFPLQFLSHRNTHEARHVNNVMHVKIAMIGGSYNSSRNRILQKRSTHSKHQHRGVCSRSLGKIHWHRNHLFG